MKGTLSKIKATHESLSPAPRALQMFAWLVLGFRCASPQGRVPRPSSSAGVRDFTLSLAPRVYELVRWCTPTQLCCDPVDHRFEETRGTNAKVI